MTTISDVIRLKKEKKYRLEEAHDRLKEIISSETTPNKQERVQDHPEVRIPAGVQKTEEEGMAEREALREKARKRAEKFKK